MTPAESAAATVPAVSIDPALARRVARAARTVDTITARRDKAVAERDAAVLEASAAGASLREIAEVAGISHVAVKNIVDRSRQQ